MWSWGRGVQNTNKHLPFVSYDNAVLLYTFNSSVQGTSLCFNELRSGMEWYPHPCGLTGPLFSVSCSPVWFCFGWRGASCLSRRLQLTGVIRFLHHLPRALFCLLLICVWIEKQRELFYLGGFAAFKHISVWAYSIFIVLLHKSEWTEQIVHLNSSCSRNYFIFGFISYIWFIKKISFLVNDYKSYFDKRCLYFLRHTVDHD